MSRIRVRGRNVNEEGTTLHDRVHYRPFFRPSADRRVRRRNGRRTAVRVLGPGRRRYPGRSEPGKGESQRRPVARVLDMAQRPGHTLHRRRLRVRLHYQR